jgi:hypothetical protein
MDDIKMDLVEVEWGSVDSIGQAQDTYMWTGLVDAVLNLRVP